MRERLLKKVLPLVLSAVLLFGAFPLDVHVHAEDLSVEAQQAVVNRPMDQWFFPLPEDCLGTIQDFAGCRGANASALYGTANEGCTQDHVNLANGSPELVVFLSDMKPVYAPAAGTLYRGGQTEDNWSGAVVLEVPVPDTGFSYYLILGGVSADAASGSYVEAGTALGYAVGTFRFAALMDNANMGEYIASGISQELNSLGWLTESVGRGLVCVNPSAATQSQYLSEAVYQHSGPVSFWFVQASQPPADTQPQEPPVDPLPQDPVHSHVFDQAVASDTYQAFAATCTSPALYYYSCACGEKGTETFAFGEAAGHAWNAGEVTQSPTHTASGSIRYTCGVCGAVSDETLPAITEHTFDQEVVDNEKYLASAATCSGPALYYKSCVCGEKGTETFAFGEAGAHAWNAGEVTQSPTHTASGSIRYTCSVCGAVSDETLPAITDHTFDQEVASDTYQAFAATCTSPALYYKSCVCGEKGTETFAFGEAAAHAWNAGEVTQSPTHTASGSIRYTCSVCGAVSDETLPAITDHTFDQEVVDNEKYLASAATCSGPALYYKSCICGEKGTETFAFGEAAAHAWNAGEVTQSPTHAASGSIRYTCSVCGAVNDETLPAITDHTFDQEVVDNEKYLASAATCSGPALYYKSCVCGEKGTETFAFGEAAAHTYSGDWSRDENNHWRAATCQHTGEVTDFGPHNWNDGEIIKDAGHVTDGEKVYTCKVCDAQKTEVLPGQPHEYNQEVAEEKYLASAATCTSPALYYKSCVCGEKGTETFASGQAKGHTFSDSWSSDELQHWRAATCEHTGERVEVADHIWGPGEITTQPTATTKGVETFTCTVCGKQKTEDVEPSEHQHTFAATWAGNSTYHWHPATCEHTNVVSGLGEHSWNDGVITIQPTHSTAGEKTFTCSACNGQKKEVIAQTHTFDQLNTSSAFLASPATCTSPATYYYSCTCGAKDTTRTFTSGSALGHTASGVWGKDANYHWNVCSRCGAKGQLVAHSMDNAGKCTVCGYSKDEGHVHSSHLTRVSAKAPTCTADGNIAYYICDCGQWFTDVTCTTPITDPNSVVQPAMGHVDQDNNGRCDVCKERLDDTMEYQITEGGESTWLNTSNQGMVFRSNAEYAKFDRVEVDGATVAVTNYSVSEGSTIVELNASYLKRLSLGRHTISIVAKDGKATTGFTIKQGASASGQSGGSGIWGMILFLTVIVAIAIPVAYGVYYYRKKTGNY